VEIQEALNDAHQKETDYQVQTKKDNHPKGGGKGGYGSSIMYGSFSVISLIGLALTKK
jgi:hypothetical protein